MKTLTWFYWMRTIPEAGFCFQVVSASMQAFCSLRPRLVSDMSFPNKQGEGRAWSSPCVSRAEANRKWELPPAFPPVSGGEQAPLQVVLIKSGWDHGIKAQKHKSCLETKGKKGMGNAFIPMLTVPALIRLNYFQLDLSPLPGK